jgi:hypothetical protein
LLDRHVVPTFRHRDDGKLLFARLGQRDRAAILDPVVSAEPAAGDGSRKSFELIVRLLKS